MTQSVPQPQVSPAPPSFQDYFVNMGPQHPSTHGVLRLIVKLAGETVLGVTPHMGFVHRGIEKMGEAQTAIQFTHLTSRLDYLSAHINNWGWALAVEQALGVSVPERAEYIRVLMSELTRVASHQLWWGVFGMDLGAFTPFLYAFRDREMVNDLFEKTCGTRLTMNYIVPGGVMAELHDTFIPETRKFVEYFKPIIEEYERLLSGNVIIQERTQGVGILSADMAKAYGVTGPALRASGVDYDVRKNRPYGFYPRFDFKTAVASDGDSWARYVVRLEEMRQSLKIIEQALEQMPKDGPLRTKLPAVPKLAPGRYLSRVESARGEIAFYLVGEGKANPYRVKIRSPGFSNLSVFPEIIRGWRVADIVVVLSTFDVVMPDIDR
ncbi:MAG TPA: NADH-quinone oxidoreductase subunit D [Candidatus Paceibacterota bacterium]|nr:NADH-quinone oxidoreductase subunit D [Verrucomicrobiota bacterium]HRY49227.1 NADH-quinone oxidoreductase subunit D [Candidatus Paceibacterota bacterium]